MDDDDLSTGDLQRLLHTYAIERADEQHTASLIGAFIGTGLAFIIGTTAFLSSACYSKPTGCNSLPDALVGLAPLPAWVLGSLLIFNVATSQLRQQYIVELEEEIARRGASYRRYPRFTALQLGFYQPSPDGIRKSLWAPLLARITALTPVILILAFSAFAIWGAGDKAGVPLWMQILATIVYVAIGGLSVGAAVWAGGNADQMHQWAEERLRAQGKQRASRSNAR